LAPKLSPPLHSLGKISSRLPRFPSHGLRSLAHQGGFGIASSVFGQQKTVNIVTVNNPDSQTEKVIK
jgi:hypothetical protein